MYKIVRLIIIYNQLHTSIHTFLLRFLVLLKCILIPTHIVVIFPKVIIDFPYLVIYYFIFYFVSLISDHTVMLFPET